MPKMYKVLAARFHAQANYTFHFA